MIMCAVGIRAAFHDGVGRLLAAAATRSVQPKYADRAVEFSSSDPETHSARALTLYNSTNLEGAIRELERAAELRPSDYLLWLQLGRARDEAGQKENAFAAMQKAIALAPYYSDPHWQYGNLLYRAGRFDEAFRELKLAVKSDPSLFPALADLAWGTYSGNVSAVKSMAVPETDAQRFSLARFLVRKDRVEEALSLIRGASGEPADERRRLIIDLIAGGHFRGAYEVWSGKPYSDGIAKITNPGFEEKLVLEHGFGWYAEHRLETVQLSVETKQPKSGTSCLSVEWRGESNPPAAIVSQLVLVEPNTKYRLTFYGRAQELVTGGPPLISITDADEKQARVLGTTKTFDPNSEWRPYEATFATGEKTEAVRLTLLRENCPEGRCPAFGKVWLDDFDLRRE